MSNEIKRENDIKLFKNTDFDIRIFLSINILKRKNIYNKLTLFY